MKRMIENKLIYKMCLIKKPLFIISSIFILKSLTVIYLTNLTKCSGNDTFIGMASMSGDAYSYITPIDNFISEGTYHYNNSKAGRMPYLGLIYYIFRLFFEQPFALSLLVILQTLIESIAIYYLAKLCELLLKTQKAFWIFIALSLLSLHVTIFNFAILSESLGISFICLFSYHYYIYLTTKRIPKQLIIAGLFLTISILFKPYLVLLFIAIGIEFLWYYRFEKIVLILKKTVIASFLVSIPLIVIDFPWTLRNYFLFNKFIPFQENIYAGYNYSRANLSVRNFIQTIGESIIYWDKRSAGCFFEPKNDYPCEYILPNRIFSKNLTLDKIEAARNIYIEYQVSPNDSLNNLTVQKFNELSEIYKKENSFSYYFIKPLFLCKHFLLHSGSYYLPISKNSVCYHSYQWVLKLSQSILYYLALLFGFIGCILLLKQNAKSFLIILIPVYLVLLFPIVLNLTEFRYFHLAYPFLLVGLTYAILNVKKIIKYLYELIPFKKQFYLLTKKVIKLPESIYKHLHFKGVIEVKIDAYHSFKMIHHGTSEENELFWGGIDNGWEKTSLKLWRKLCLETPIVLDIGANTGLYSLVTKALNPTAKIYAFEPLPKVLEYLNYNVEINNYDVTVISKAVSNFNGTAKVFLIDGQDFSTSVTVNKSLLADTTPQKELEIECVTLADFITKNNITQIDLMKIDVETHEPEVLEGMGEYLDKFKPDFLIEIWDKECAIKINKLLKNKGYLYFDIDDKNDVVTQKEEITVSSFWNYLICKPETAKKINLI